MRSSSSRRLAAALLVAATLAAAFASSVGCIFRVPASRTPGETATTIPGVPRLDFHDDDCGAGSLATLLTFWGTPTTVEDLGERLPKLRRGEVLSVDLMLAARERGLEARWLAADAERLRREIDSGRPALVLLKVAETPGTRRDYFHYAIVDGFDPAPPGADGPLARLLLGDGEARWVPLARLERAWRGADRGLLRVEPAEAVEARLQRALAAERDGAPDRAAALYREVLDARPGSVVAWTNLGNALASSGKADEAAAAYRSALAFAPDDVDALNNLAWLLATTGGDAVEAERLATRALALETDPARRAAIRDTLERARDR